MVAARSGLPRVGQRAPAFRLPSESGRPAALSEFRGKPTVVYFYPKDDTPGCTVEAQQFQARFVDFEREGAVVLGISPDDAASHCRFAEKYGLSFVLLSDEKHEAAQAYGVWVEKVRAGRKYWGVQRATFLVDGEGKIARVWPEVKPDGHAAEVLEAVRGLRRG